LTEANLSLVIGLLVFLGVFLVNYRGLGNSAKLAYLLVFISLTPLLLITIAPFITGAFKLSNITTHWLPVEWKWDPFHLALLFGILGMAEWSACASEAAAVYGPEYKKPGTDLPKALFACGVVSFFTYSIVQASATGTLGVEGILAERLSPLLPLAKVSFGPIGTYMTIAMLIAAMILLIQMAFLTASRAMHSMSMSGNLPEVFARTNKYGTPVIAMIAVVLMNMVLILVGSPEAILAAASFGYMLAHG
jgi:amino acid transporter